MKATLIKYPKVVLMASIGILSVTFSSCGSQQTQGAASQQPPAAYETFTVTPQSATLNTNYPASIQGEQDIDIRPKVDGYIDKIYVVEGQVVKKGQLLFKLSAPQYEQDVKNSVAAINSAKADINSAEIAVTKPNHWLIKGSSRTTNWKPIKIR